MKTIVENATSLSKYLVEDSVAITASSDCIVIGDPAKLIVDDLNSANATIRENVTNAPEDWIGNKYTFDGTTWAEDSNWVALE